MDTEVFEESFEIMAPEGAETDGWQDPEAETEGVIFPIKPYSPEAWVWNTVSHTNGNTEKNIQVTLPGQLDRILNYSYTATVETFAGSQADQDAFRDQNVSPEDALVLDLFAQYCMSLYTMDYGSHFLLFHPAIVEERFTKEVAPHSYEAALGTINTLLGLMLPYDTVSADITLTGNYALTGDALDEYLADLRKRTESAGLSIENVTAASLPRSGVTGRTSTALSMMGSGIWTVGTWTMTSASTLPCPARFKARATSAPRPTKAPWPSWRRVISSLTTEVFLPPTPSRIRSRRAVWLWEIKSA